MACGVQGDESGGSAGVATCSLCNGWVEGSVLSGNYRARFFLVHLPTAVS
jgi:hypothetical protein